MNTESGIEVKEGAITIAMGEGSDKETFPLRTFSVGEPAESDIISPGIMSTGGVNDIRGLYSRLPLLRCGDNRLMYTFLTPFFGDFTTAEGQSQFKDSGLVLMDKGFEPPDWAWKLYQFALLKSKKVFKVDGIMACLRDLQVVNGRYIFHIGPGFYSESFFTNGAGGMTVNLSKTEKDDLKKYLSTSAYEWLLELSGELRLRYGSSLTMREIIARQFEFYNGLPPFEAHIHNNNIGVSSLLMTADGYFIYVNRGKGVSVHQGIGATASGAVEFDRETLAQKGLPYALAHQMGKEIREENGLGSGTLLLGAMQKRIRLELGVDTDEYDLVPICFVRELLRGGKPELWFMVRYKGTVNDIVKKIINNPYSGKAEIENLVYAQPVNDAMKMIKHREADGFLSHVLLAELYLTVEYLQNNP